jgi:hypothetical protein
MIRPDSGEFPDFAPGSLPASGYQWFGHVVAEGGWWEYGASSSRLSGFYKQEVLREL